MSASALLRLSVLPQSTSLNHLPILPHRLKPIPSSHVCRPLIKPNSKITASYRPTPATDRLISAASYFLPFFNGLQYGRFLFQKYPALSLPFQPLLPLLSLYHSIPYAAFVSFFALYLGVIRNPSFSRYVRFNALQALVLDVLLALPSLLQRIISPSRAGIGLKIVGWAHSGLFIFVVACFVYGLVASILGKTPYLPLVAEAAGRQLE